MPTPKNPLANLKYRAKIGKPVTVAFFGGSITWGGNSSDNETKSYRALVGNWFLSKFPNTRVNLINGGYGGTGSAVGAFRFDEQILAHDPDLVFVEFSINDSSAWQSTVMAAHEAFIRKAWKKNPATALILLISGSRDDRQGELVTKKIGADFGLHVIDVGTEKRRLVQTGKYSHADLYTDVVHPTDTGHAVYAGIVKRQLDKLLKSAPARPLRFSLPKKFKYWRTVEYANATLVPAKDCRTTGKGWRQIESHHRRFDGVYPEIATWPDRRNWPFPYRKGLMTTSRPGDAIVYTGKVRRFGLALDYTKGLCRYEVFVDGKSVGVFEHNQPQGRFPRVPILDNLLDGGKHSLRVVLRKGRLNIGYFQIGR